MPSNFTPEVWKPVAFDEEIINDNRLEVSSHGRIRSFNKISDGKILNGSMINGYRIIRLKLFMPRSETVSRQLASLKEQSFKLARKIKALKETGEIKTVIQEHENMLAFLKAKLKKKFADDTKKRTIHKHFLVHRLVADYFLPAPKQNQTIVGHLDFNKLNNHSANLKWMTHEENVAHQANSPYVIAEKKERRSRRPNTKAAKLTITKVMLLKKLLSQGKNIRKLSKQFKITDTQVLRIKRGENWGDIETPQY